MAIASVRRLHIVCTAAAVIVALSSAGCSSGEEAYDALRERMVQSQIVSRGVTAGPVIEAMMRVPRHRFVPSHLRGLAYIDSPLPIGNGQTISQPYIVALMTESLALEDSNRVLEIGTGSGYQAAVLAEIVDTVFTIEIVPALAEQAAAVLDTLGYGNVLVRCGDGYDGWPEKAPFDGVIVTAAAPVIPTALIEQLAVGGRIVIPVGEDMQVLEVHEKQMEGLRLLFTLPVRFVPMTGKIRESR